ncbi:MAG: L,D-transpeptidase family protein [Alcanivorax sp.]
MSSFSPFFRAISILCICIFVMQAAPSYARSIHAQTVIDTYYMTRQGEPLWLSGKRLSRAGKTVLKTLEGAWSHGLNPELYYVSDIEYILESDYANDPELLLKLELLVTSGLVRYIQDLSGMRVDAHALQLRPKDWNMRISAQDALSMIPENAEGIQEFLDGLGPQTATYQRLKEELKRFASKDDEQAVEPIDFNATLYPGRGHENIPKLRERFGLQGNDTEARYTYDEALVNAIKEFQADHDLKPDGIIGNKTIFVLNQGKADKIKQIILNMERLRWVPDEKPDRFIVVNIPNAQLWAIENGEIAFSMPVVVGRKKRPTLSFVTEVHGVRFNPTWSVPPTVKKEDIWPKLKENAAYLSDKGMELRDGYQQASLTLDPQSIDWQGISEDELIALNMVQIPGDHNPLGRIRVLMPNEHNIYLHDTNDKGLFYKSDRALSSGCVRMKYPEKVANFVLRDVGSWDTTKADALIAAGETKEIYTRAPYITVYLLYYTTWINSDNKVVYGQDIYDWDQLLLQELEKLDGVPIMLDNH